VAERPTRPGHPADDQAPTRQPEADIAQMITNGDVPAHIPAQQVRMSE
jgi:hypothetical protein